MVAHGVRIKFRVNDPEVTDLLLSALPPGWRHTSESTSDLRYAVIVGRRGKGVEPAEKHQLFFGAQILCQTNDVEKLFAVLAEDLHFRIAVIARHKVFVNAGVVGWRGQAILLPGNATSGKSTLVHALVRAGAVYYSDMFAVVDASGLVHPYGVPLEPDPSDDAFFEVLVDGPARTTPLPVGLIAFTHYDPWASWRPRVLSPDAALAELTAHSVLSPINHEGVRQTLRGAVGGATCLAGARGEAASTAQALLAALMTSRADVTGWSSTRNPNAQWRVRRSRAPGW